MKTHWFKLLCAALVLSLLAACSSNNGGSSGGTATGGSNSNAPKEVELSFLYQMDDRWTQQFWDNIVSKFESQHPGIKLKAMSYPSVDKKQEYIQTLHATGQMPDVTYAGLEAMKLVKDVFLELPENLYSLLDDTAIHMQDGKVYTMPTSMYIMLDIFYNKEIFEKYSLSPPNTWEEFIKINETLKANGVTPLVEAGQATAGMLFHNPMVTVMLNEIDENYPQKLLSGELTFNGPEMTEIAERFQSLWTNGFYHEGSLSFTGAQKQQKFMDGEAAMVVDGQFSSRQISEGSDFTVGWFPLPAMTNADIYPVMYGEDVGVSAKTKHPEEALKLVEFLFSDEIYQQIIEVGNSGYTTKKAYTYEQDYLTKEMYEVVQDKKAKIVFMKITDFPAPTAEAMRTAAADLAHGGNIKSTLDKFESTFRTLIEAQK